jgi:hypothetical protein
MNAKEEIEVVSVHKPCEVRHRRGEESKIGVGEEGQSCSWILAIKVLQVEASS